MFPSFTSDLIFASDLNFAFDFFNLLLVRFHQVEVIVVKHLIQERNNEAWVGDWELNQQPCDHGRRKNDAQNYSATLPTERF